MKTNQRRALLATAILGAVLLQGCATKIKASSTENPPPAKAFSTYGRIEVKHVTFKEGYRGDAAGLAKIDENMQTKLAPALAKWNARPANGRTLTVEPVIEEMSFKHGAKRVLLGPLAGSSGVLMRMTIRDNSGGVVATPEFFQRTAAGSGGFSMGVMDNLMLTRVADLASNYIVNNYTQSVGGATGADLDAVAPR